MRCDVVVAGLALAASVVLLGGCAAGPPTTPPPATEAERDTALERYYDERWEHLSRLIPELVRPQVERIAVVDDVEWSETVAACVDDRDDSAEDQDAFQIALLVCQEQYPSRSLFESVRSDAQLDYLYDYYANFVEPCLELGGFDVPPTPTREEFFADGGYTWNIYQDSERRSSALKHMLRTMCPPPSL